MEAIIGVWLSSLLGAAGFSAAGYVLGQHGVVIPFLKLEQAPAAMPPALAPVAAKVQATNPETGDRPTPNLSEPESTETKRHAELVDLAAEELRRATNASSSSKSASASGVARLHEEDEKEEDRETLVTDAAMRPISTPIIASTTPTPPTPSSSPSLPPPRVPPKRPSLSGEPTDSASAQELRLVKAELAVLKSDLEEARGRLEKSAEDARAESAVRSELERQLEAVRTELKQEAVARAAAERTVQELGDRVASASEEAATLRHRSSTLDKQSRQLREALQGRVRALTTSEWHRRRDLEEAEDMRVKLRDVYDKLERSTLPPSPPTSSSAPPGAPAPLAPVVVGVDAPPRTALRSEDSVLRQEIVRLTQENRTLRARALGSSPMKAAPSRGSVPDVDLETYRTMIAQIVAIDGLVGAVVGDELGSALVGSGNLADGLAAFGAYIRDASGRSEGLLPLETLDQVEIKDRAGTLLSARVIGQAPSELLLVLLGSVDATGAAKRSVEETLRAR